jgi:DNA-binding NarL/FixJ family response regulator
MMCLPRKELEAEGISLALQRDFPWHCGHSRTVGGAATPAACNTLWHTLMDIRMPVIDGLDATVGIKSRWPEIKVLVLSLYEGRQEEARAAGADLFVSKG